MTVSREAPRSQDSLPPPINAGSRGVVSPTSARVQEAESLTPGSGRPSPAGEGPRLRLPHRGMTGGRFFTPAREPHGQRPARPLFPGRRKVRGNHGDGGGREKKETRRPAASEGGGGGGRCHGAERPGGAAGRLRTRRAQPPPLRARPHPAATRALGNGTNRRRPSTGLAPRFRRKPRAGIVTTKEGADFGGSAT